MRQFEVAFCGVIWVNAEDVESAKEMASELMTKRMKQAELGFPAHSGVEWIDIDNSLEDPVEDVTEE